MTYEKLIQHADGGHVECEMDHDNIVKVKFLLCGIQITAQFDSDNAGIYGPQISMENLIELAEQSIAK